MRKSSSSALWLKYDAAIRKRMSKMSRVEILYSSQYSETKSKTVSV